MASSLRLLVFSLLVSAALALSSPYVVHEKRTNVPKGWLYSRKHSPSAIIPLRFGLKQSNMDKLDEMLHNVSHPESPHYGKHWTPEQVARTFAPSANTYNTVKEWLIESGISPEKVKLAPTKTWIEVNTTVEDAERLLKTEYNVYVHGSGKEHIACDFYHLPLRVSTEIDIVTPTIHFNSVITRRGRTLHKSTKELGHPHNGLAHDSISTLTHMSNGLDTCDTMITPSCLRALYGIDYEAVSASNNSFGIVEYTPQAYLQSDLDLFSSYYSPSMMGKSPKLASIDGGVVQTAVTGFNYNGESNLDLQYAMSLVNPAESYKQDITLYQVGDIPQGGTFNNLLDALDASYCTYMGGDDPFVDGFYPDDYSNGYGGPLNCGTEKPANVISTSYGLNEADLSYLYTARQCSEYAKLGLMGVTVLYSSGDSGVAGTAGLCLNPDGSQTVDGSKFNPGFPATCPYVTSVGATQINPGANTTEPESACQQVISSGGGFSNHFALPEYQKSAVSRYMKDYTPNYAPGVWNSTGTSRGYPDIAANGANYIVAVNGQLSRVYGTSAATPVVGAILTLVNDARITAGKSPIGFINPTIYSESFVDAFNDISSGVNEGCGTSGFSSAPGWDPVTGLGTPSFPQLVKKWLELP